MENLRFGKEIYFHVLVFYTGNTRGSLGELELRGNTRPTVSCSSPSISRSPRQTSTSVSITVWKHATQRRFKLPCTRELASCNTSSLQNNPTAGHTTTCICLQFYRSLQYLFHPNLRSKLQEKKGRKTFINVLTTRSLPEESRMVLKSSTKTCEVSVLFFCFFPGIECYVPEPNSLCPLGFVLAGGLKLPKAFSTFFLPSSTNQLKGYVYMATLLAV